jgi:hypothetical protein
LAIVASTSAIRVAVGIFTESERAIGLVLSFDCIYIISLGSDI